MSIRYITYFIYIIFSLFTIEAAEKSQQIDSYNIYTFNNVFKKEFLDIIVKDWVDNYQKITGDNNSNKSKEEKVLDLIKLRYPKTKITVNDIKNLIENPNSLKERSQNARIIRSVLEALTGLYELATAETEQTTEEANDCNSDPYIEDIATLFRLGKLCQKQHLVDDDIKALDGREDKELNSLKTNIEKDLKQLQNDNNIVGRTVILTDKQEGTLNYLKNALDQIDNYGRMDNYTTFIGSRHFETLEDHKNLELSNHRFFGNSTKYHYNPVPLTIRNIKLFPKIQTVYCYSEEEFKDFIEVLISDDKEIQDIVNRIIKVRFFVPTRIPGLKHAEVKGIHRGFLERLINYKTYLLNTAYSRLSKYMSVYSDYYRGDELPYANKTLVITPFIDLNGIEELPDIQNIITYKKTSLNNRYKNIKNYEGPDMYFYYMNNLTNIISTLYAQIAIDTTKLVIKGCPKLEYLEILADKKAPLSLSITECPNLKTIRMPSWCKHKEFEEYLKLNNENIRFEYYQFDNDLKNYDNDTIYFNEYVKSGNVLIIPDSIKKITFFEQVRFDNYRYIFLPKHFENTEVHTLFKSKSPSSAKIIFYTNDSDDDCESYLEEDC